MLLGCHHIELNIPDLEKSKNFYMALCEFFPESKIEEMENAFQWHFADLYLHFNQVSGNFSDTPAQRKRMGLHHLAFEVQTKEEIDRFQEFLIERGIRILFPAAFYGPLDYAVFFEDPSRIKLEFGVDLSEDQSDAVDAS